MLKPAAVEFSVANGNAILQGSPWGAEITITEREDGVDTPVDISGMLGSCVIKNSAKSHEILAVPYFLIVDGPAGKFSLALTAEETAAITTPGKSHRETTRLYFEAHLDEFRILHGIVEVVPSIATAGTPPIVNPFTGGTGPQGPQGPKGDPGIPGPNVVITEAKEGPFSESGIPQNAIPIIQSLSTMESTTFSGAMHEAFDWFPGIPEWLKGHHQTSLFTNGLAYTKQKDLYNVSGYLEVALAHIVEALYYLEMDFNIYNKGTVPGTEEVIFDLLPDWGSFHPIGYPQGHAKGLTSPYNGLSILRWENTGIAIIKLELGVFTTNTDRLKYSDIQTLPFRGHISCLARIGSAN
jgi:hypothetical protein